MIDMWVLKALPEKREIISDGFYTGKTYIFQNAKYAVVDRDISKAKKYTSYARAIRAASKLCFENYIFDVERLSAEIKEADHA